jgi:hypothetical protein
MKLWVDLLLKAWQYVPGHFYWVTVGKEWVPGKRSSPTIIIICMMFKIKKALLSNTEPGSIKQADDKRRYTGFPGNIAKSRTINIAPYI